MTEEQVTQRLQEAFPQAEIVVFDQTGGGSNFELRIATNELEDLSRVQQHQKIMSFFAAELQSGEMHALSIKVINPSA